MPSAATSETPSDALVELGQEIKAERLRHRWTQAELARASGVSTRTIGQLESGERKAIDYRPVVRLAVALGVEPLRWLTLAGPLNVSDAEIEAAVAEAHRKRRSAVMGGAPGVGAFEDWVTQRRAKPDESRALLVIVWRATPNPSDREELIEIGARAIQRGVAVAVAMPYPQPAAQERAGHPDLAVRLVQSHGHVEAFVHVLRRRVGPSKADVVALFRRRREGMPPPPMILRTWPVVMLDGGRDLDDPQALDVAEFVLEPSPSAGRMLDPGAGGVGASDERASLVAIWRDYLREILEAWHPSEKKVWQSLHESAAWIDVPPPDA